MPTCGHAQPGGEIIVCQVSANSNTYQITIITHTKLSAPADRPELAINWGDSPIWDTIARELHHGHPGAGPAPERIRDRTHLCGPGVYILSIDDQNRNGGVINIPNSIAQSFSVKTRW